MTVDKITNPPSQKVVIEKINEVIDNLGGGGVAPVWGNITGTLSNQTDLQTELNKKLENTATGSGCLTIAGNPSTSSNAMNIGTNSTANGGASIAIGRSANSKKTGSIAIGHSAVTSANYAIQIGFGTNSTASTLNIGFNASTASARTNWTLLDGLTGLIPDERISSNIARTSQIPSAVTESTVSGWGFTKNTGTVTSVNNVQPVNGNVTLTIPDTSNLANKDLSNLSATGEAHFQAPLVSGTSIKTINNTSILGSGNIDTDNVYWATYGTTTFTDIMTAINAGKLVMCSSASGSISVTFVYRSHTDSSVTFYNVHDGGNTLVSVDSSNVWDMSDSTFLPNQYNQNGKFLTTNGMTASWATITIPTPTYDSVNERITW